MLKVARENFDSASSTSDAAWLNAEATPHPPQSRLSTPIPGPWTWALDPGPWTLDPALTLHPRLSTLDPRPQALNPKP